MCGNIAGANNLRILFVCIGNSCRSPMAESVLKAIVAKADPSPNWMVDSAAIADWNVGLSPEERCIQVLGEHGLTSDHIARKINDLDFYEFDYIFGMDDMNIRHLNELAPSDKTAHIELLGSYDYGKDNIIDDPYFETGVESFRRAYEKIQRSCANFFNNKTQ